VLDILGESNQDFVDSSITHKLQGLRNVFAHQKAEYLEENHKMRLGGKEYSMDDFLDLRKKLIKLKKILNDVSNN
jgi:hypothetical protein